MRRLSPQAALADVAAAYAYPPLPGEGRPWVRANMIASADGAATLEGRSGGLGGEGDRRLFVLLRGLCDAVVVGAGTVRAEGYGPARPDASWEPLRAGRPATPAVVIVSQRLDLDFDAPVFTEAASDAPTIVVTSATADPARLRTARERAEVVVAGRDGVDFFTAFTELAARGCSRLLCEGGPQLLAQIAAAGMLDELCLTLSPLLTAGNSPRVMDGPPLPEAHTKMRLVHALVDSEDEGFLYLRYVRAGL